MQSLPDSTVTLREYLEGRLAELDGKVHRRWEAHYESHALLQRDLDKTEAQLEARLEGMNEFRKQLDRQSALFITRDMHDALISNVKQEQQRIEGSFNVRLAPLEDFQKKFLGQVIAIAAAFTVLNVLIVIFDRLAR